MNLSERVISREIGLFNTYSMFFALFAVLLDIKVCSLGWTGNLEHLKDVPHVIPDAVAAQPQRGTNLLIGLSPGYRRQNSELPSGKPVNFCYFLRYYLPMEPFLYM